MESINEKTYVTCLTCITLEHKLLEGRGLVAFTSVSSALPRAAVTKHIEWMGTAHGSNYHDYCPEYILVQLQSIFLF